MAIEQFNAEKIITKITIPKTKILITLIVTTILITGMIFMSSPQVFAHKIDTELNFVLSDNSVYEGTDVLMTGTVTTIDTPAGGGPNNPAHMAENPVNVGTGKIEQGYNFDESLASVCPAHHYHDISSTTPVDGDFTKLFDTTGLGGQTLVFRAHYTTSGGPHGTATFSGTDCTSLEITAGGDPIEVEKTWTHTDYNWDPVCDISLGVPGFVNPADGMCYSEDTFVNDIGFRPANINNVEDDVLADTFSQDSDDKYLVGSNVHPTKDEFQNTQPGAFYALTTIDVQADVDGLTVWENYDDCIDQGVLPAGADDLMDLKLLAPADKPSRAVKIAIADSSRDVTEITDEIYDGIGGEITSIDNNSAHVDILREIPAGSTVYVLVKFQDDLKGYDTGDGFFDGMCDNNEMVSELVEEPDDVYTPDFSDLANAALRIGNDYDGDTITNNQDNCPLDANLDQADTDSDGAGDVCDVCEGDDFADKDNDGLLCFEDPDDNP